MAYHIGRKYDGKSINFAETIFYDCQLKNCTQEGVEVDSIFVDCRFEGVDLYWCVSTGARFLNCSFVRCDLRGSFYGAVFIRCIFEDCETGRDNMGGTTEWEGAEAIDCTLVRTVLPIVPHREDA